MVAASLVMAPTAQSSTPSPDGPRIDAALVERQPAMIDTAVEAMAPHAAPGAQMFFLGFAGYGGERVFAEEIDLASRRIAERYGTAHRSLRLVNDRRDLTTWPLASERALRYALKALGRVMDDDDVLFLALSSHGWRDATVSIANSGMRDDELSAAELSAALENSGIHWRVIVISACYSGSFIDALAGERTIVLTAASRDRASFGCSDERHLTYFGESFYQDALPAAASLRAAFDATRHAILLRERAEKLEPSQPQASFGTLMEAKLAELEPGSYGSSVVPMR